MFWLKDQTVLITGVSSYEKQYAEYLLKHANLKRLIVFSRDEQKHVESRRNHFSQECYAEIRYFIGEVRDADRLRRAFQDVDCAIHAAAMKHVDVAEYNPQECSDNNAHWLTLEQLRSKIQESDQAVLAASQPVTLAA